MSLDPIAAYTTYAAAWSESGDPDARESLLDACWSDDGAIFDPETPQGLIGAEALSDYISRTHDEMPGLVIAETSAPEVIGNRLRVRWVARQDGVQVYTGTDFVEFAEDGRIRRVTMFYDSTPD